MSALKSVRTGIVCVAGLALTAMATEPGARALTADGDRLMNENGLADAVHAYRSAIRLSTSSGDLIQTGIALDHLGIAYNLLGDDQNAETSFTRAINAFLVGRENPARIWSEVTWTWRHCIASSTDIAAHTSLQNRRSQFDAAIPKTLERRHWP